MKNIFKIVLSIIIVFILGYFIYKGIILFRYDIDSFETESLESFIEAYEEKSIKKIIHDEAEEYIQYGNIKIENKFNNFVKDELSSNNLLDVDIYKLEENGRFKAAFYIGQTMSYYDIFIDKDKEFYNGSNNTKLRDISGIDIKKVFDDNNIIDDVTLFNYLLKYEDRDINIFTSVKEIKEYYTVMLIANVVFPEIDDFILYEGEYLGYALNIDDDWYEVHLIHDDKCYILTFSGNNYFSDIDIDLLLNTVVIE